MKAGRYTIQIADREYPINVSSERTVFREQDGVFVKSVQQIVEYSLGCECCWREIGEVQPEEPDEQVIAKCVQWIKDDLEERKRRAIEREEKDRIARLEYLERERNNETYNRRKWYQIF
jgi:hypothetical protein